MYIRKTTKNYKGKSYDNYLLVESVHTANGPRQKVICSLGRLSPGPKEKWLELARKIEESLTGQLSLGGEDERAKATAERIKRGKESVVQVRIEDVSVEEAREAGPIHVGHKMWQRLGMDKILKDLGFSNCLSLLTEAMVLNRLISPASENAMVDWMKKTAISDILGVIREKDSLYRNLDRLYPLRFEIETALSNREASLFNLNDTIYLYDLTSTYFEGLCLKNDKAKRGYSRDKRPDAKQVVIGLVIGKEGFPKAHEVFEGSRQDKTTVLDMLEILKKRNPFDDEATVVVDRGMAFDDNLNQIKAAGYHFLVATRQKEREDWLAEFSGEEFEEMLRLPSPSNQYQNKSKVKILKKEKDGVAYVLVISQERSEKDRAIREQGASRLISDLEKLKGRIEKGKLVSVDKINQAIGRLKERYPRVARYYNITYDPENKLTFTEDEAKKRQAQALDGAYLLKTDRTDMSSDEIWQTYMLLTRVEKAFKDMKSPLSERPIFHQLLKRVETHIFLCVLAYHLLVAIEKSFLDLGIHTSWATIRKKLSTHQVVTVVLPTGNGSTLKIRRGTTPEKEHKDVYRILNICEEPIKPKRSWVKTS